LMERGGKDEILREDKRMRTEKKEYRRKRMRERAYKGTDADERKTNTTKQKGGKRNRETDRREGTTGM
jgi:hypothetical protein